MGIIHKGMSFEDRVKLDTVMADLEKAKAIIDYLAMMSDIELPIEDE